MVPFRRKYLAAGLLAVACALPAAAQQVATVASSQPTLRGTPPGGATRDLALGSALVQDETVQSSATGRAQLMFLDQTTLSIAPNTTIVLDRFVFDPDQGSGELGVQLTEGALRFIGGSLARNQEAVITTPTSTIGIRGSSTLILHSNGRTTAIFLAGDRLCFSAGSGRNCTSRPGGMINEDGYQGRVSNEFLAAVLNEVDGGPVVVTSGGGGTGGGTGIGDAAPPGSAPTSPDGESYDTQVFDNGFDSDTLLGLIDTLTPPEAAPPPAPPEPEPELPPLR
ncbi:FecR family protein [Roseibacterium sp. SDUM158017]|uniref:FecR family protein n=1 Tax=Roseicyclus salinarum TaxID=3036773 RepID=UPI002414F5F9|nr:FecR family protein [Roseibacterium sp. SDUM158017]MDG4649986.1 FecR family protein [Roseibacterium sp. SDUM158017]